MKAVLISIQPKWCEAIAAGEKTIEVRKTAPKCEVPFKVYIYETKESKRRYLDDRFNSFFSNKSHYTDMGKVIGEFICRGIMQPFNSLRLMAKESCLTEEELVTYSNGKSLYGWRISDLKIYDKPKELSEYIRECRQPAEIQCENCPYCNWYDYHFCTDKRRTITRPPQSWCYVEELEENND